MSSDTIWENVARKAAEVSGIKGAYAPTTGGYANVRDYVRSIADTPVAWVEWGDGSITPGSWEVTRYGFVVRVYFRATDPAAPYKLMAPMVTRFRDAWRSNRTLWGSCTESNIDGWDEATTEEWEGENVPLVVLPIRVSVVEKNSTTYSA